MNGPRASHLLRRGAVYSVRLRIPADLKRKIGMAEFARSLHTTAPAEARTRCLSAIAWFRSTIAWLQLMPFSARSDLDQAASACFSKLALELDQKRSFDVDHLDEEISWSIERIPYPESCGQLRKCRG